jgi:hypothetical protein
LNSVRSLFLVYFLLLGFALFANAQERPRSEMVLPKTCFLVGKFVQTSYGHLVFQAFSRGHNENDAIQKYFHESMNPESQAKQAYDSIIHPVYPLAEYGETITIGQMKDAIELMSANRFERLTQVNSNSSGNRFNKIQTSIYPSGFVVLAGELKVFANEEINAASKEITSLIASNQLGRTKLHPLVIVQVKGVKELEVGNDPENENRVFLISYDGPKVLP